MSIQKYSGWDYITQSSWTEIGNDSFTTYTAPKACFNLGNPNTAIVLVGLLSNIFNIASITASVTYGNVTGQIAAFGYQYTSTAYAYQFIAFIPLAGYDGVSDTLTITSTSNVLQPGANGGVYMLTLYNVDPTLNSNPIASAQFVNRPSPFVGAPVQYMPYTAGAGDWLISGCFQDQTGGAIGMGALSSFTLQSALQPTSMTGAGQHNSGIAQAAYYIVPTASFQQVGWEFSDAASYGYGLGAGIFAKAMQLVEVIPPPPPLPANPMGRFVPAQVFKAVEIDHLGQIVPRIWPTRKNNTVQA